MDDFQHVSAVMGRHRELRVWPPLELAPGVVLVPREKKIRDGKTQEVREIQRYVVPAVIDSRLYYEHLDERNKRPEDERFCPACKGVGYVRHGELVPGQRGFGMFAVCPNWVREDRRCAWQ